MLDFHQNLQCDKAGSADCLHLCKQRYAPVALSVCWSFQMFFTLLPFSAFYGFAKKHISRNESRLENKKRMRVVNSQIVLITEDVRIRNMKIITLIIQVILEALSILALTWLQMQRHNVSNVFQMNFLDILFRIPEKYQCNLGSIRQNTFFNKSWDGPNPDEPYLSPCNNNAEKITCWTHRSVESTLMHSVLLIIAGLTVFFALCELVYNVWYLSRVSFHFMFFDNFRNRPVN